MSTTWVPERGDVVWVDMDPQVGHEQSGRRPALVLSPARYNARAGLAVVCPITSRVKGYPFEVSIPDGLPVSGVVLSDQARSVDWRLRRAEFGCAAPSECVDEAAIKLTRLLGR